jgi:hypothetical protein
MRIFTSCRRRMSSSRRFVSVRRRRMRQFSSLFLWRLSWNSIRILLMWDITSRMSLRTSSASPFLISQIIKSFYPLRYKHKKQFWGLWINIFNYTLSIRKRCLKEKTSRTFLRSFKLNKNLEKASKNQG